MSRPGRDRRHKDRGWTRIGGAGVARSSDRCNATAKPPATMKMCFFCWNPEMCLNRESHGNVRIAQNTSPESDVGAKLGTTPAPDSAPLQTKPTLDHEAEAPELTPPPVSQELPRVRDALQGLPELVPRQRRGALGGLQREVDEVHVPQHVLQGLDLRESKPRALLHAVAREPLHAHLGQMSQGPTPRKCP